jgi:thymidylate synthase (FAD)
MKSMNVLDKGFIKIVDSMGGDYSILRAARTSTGSDASKGDEKDRKLIRYLYRNEHMTPFEFVQFTFHVKAPIFVARQWFRHRTFSYNEKSGRYQQFEWETYQPEYWKVQDKNNKQTSSGAAEHQELTSSMVEGIYKKNKHAYESMLEHNVAREQARVVMPVGQYTEFFFSVNLRNLLHFLELRMDYHAQYEIRQYANAIFDILNDIDNLKWTMEIFTQMRRLKEEFNGVVNKAFKENRIVDLEEHLDDFS